VGICSYYLYRVIYHAIWYKGIKNAKNPDSNVGENLIKKQKRDNRKGCLSFVGGAFLNTVEQFKNLIKS
jgi:hypothetical protein